MGISLSILLIAVGAILAAVNAEASVSTSKSPESSWSSWCHRIDRIARLLVSCSGWQSPCSRRAEYDDRRARSPREQS